MSRLAPALLCSALLAGAASAVAGALDPYERSAAAFADGLALAAQGLHEPAAEAFERALDQDRDFVEAMVNLARARLETGELAAASEWIERAGLREPGYPATWVVRGLLALRQDRLQDALRALETARARLPDDVEVLTNLGVVLLRLGILDRARSVLERARSLEPGRPEISLDLALVWEGKGDPARAAYHYRRFAGLTRADDPDRPRALERARALEARPSR